MKIENPNDLFIRLLSEANSAEKQLTRALPKMARAADDESLVEAFKEHLEETRGQVERIEQVVESDDSIRTKRLKNYAMESLIEEAQELIDGSEKGPVRDAALIGAAQKVEHVEIATYGTLATLAEQLGYQKAKELLAETLQEEKAADEKLTKLAKNDVNRKAG
ncbi:ferritin-like domain-containing protein [Halomonas korlensis]|uniref:Ferritin-like metal-binding protein YciE n=1 Tax=Halomonas korlensis TaxID=463301 RepID=A0A1I7KFC2_9GAMM|nr:ferritin-like domain-containing protein [Halomonas korlensis]SFU96137.1 Ferritin-like metal-binding protein YciE [Halomonas korlensis]